MRISEITDKNSVWAGMSNINFDEIYKSFDTIKYAWPAILNTKSTTLINIHKTNLSLFLEQLKIIEIKLHRFPDSKDLDLIKIKNYISAMINFIDSIINR